MIVHIVAVSGPENKPCDGRPAGSYPHPFDCGLLTECDDTGNATITSCEVFNKKCTTKKPCFFIPEVTDCMLESDVSC